MRSKNPLLIWLLKYQKSLGLKMNIIEKTQEILPHFMDVQVSLKFENMETIGFSTQPDVETAFLKASAEALEILFAKKLGLQSNSGTAIHTNLSKAKSHAQNELMERDLLMCHLMTKTPFIQYSPKIISKLSKENLLRKINSEGFDLNLKKMLSPKGYIFVVCIIKPIGKNNSLPVFLSSAGGKKSEQNDIETHAFLQCIRKLSYWNLCGKKSIKKNMVKPKAEFLNLWESKNKISLKAKSIKVPVLKVEVSKILLPFQKDLKVGFAVASSEHLQQWGRFPLNANRVNWNRIESFTQTSGTKLNHSELNLHIGNGFV